MTLDAVLTAMVISDSPEMKAALAEYAHEIILYRSLGAAPTQHRWVVLLTRRISRASWTERR